MQKIGLIVFLVFVSLFKNAIAQTVIPTVGLVSSINNFCAGTKVVFTATPMVGDTSPIYNFLVNGVSKQNSLIDTFASTALVNNDSVVCILHSSKYNASPDSAISNVVRIQVRKKSSKTLNPIICPGDTFFYNNNSYSTAGYYPNIFTNYVGCDSIVTIHLQVAIPPTVTVSPKIDSVCNGGKIVLTAAGALSFTWNPASIGGINDTVMPTTTTTYTVTGTDVNHCTDTAQAVIYLTTVKPAAAFTFTDSANVFVFQNTSTHATNYLWIFGDGGTSTAVNPTNNYPTIGNFSVQLIAIGLCGNDTATASFSTGINDLVNPTAMQVYPNPCKNKLSVSGIQFSEKTIIEVINVIGQKIVLPTLNLSTAYCELNTENLSSGIYFLKTIDANGNSSVVKFVKE